MNSKKLKNTVFPILIIVIGFIVIFPLSAFLENEKPELPAGFEDSDLVLQGAKLKGYSFGMEGLLADFYWMKALQYIGDKIVKSNSKVNINDLRPLNPRLLYPYLDNATDLDPRFMEAYAFGAVVLPAIDKQKAIAIARKGIKENPDQWRLYQHLGYIYWRLGDFEEAERVYSQGAEIASAPPFMKMIASRMKTQGESRETALEIYKQMLDQSDDAQIKDFARSRIMLIQSLEQIDEVNSILKKLKTRNSECVVKLSDIFSDLMKSPISEKFRVDESQNLIDPSGVPFFFNKSECKIFLDVTKTEIPTE